MQPQHRGGNKYWGKLIWSSVENLSRVWHTYLSEGTRIEKKQELIFGFLFSIMTFPRLLMFLAGDGSRKGLIGI